MAIDECQSRFASSRWNCSVVLENWVDQQRHSNKSSASGQIFGDVMQHPNRERSYLNAIIAAGLAHAMTKACSGGELPEECSCDKKIRSKSNKGRVEWVACSDDIDYGARFSRDFADNYDSEPDATSTIYIHNNEVGRRVFKSATDITCTCLNGDANNNNGLCQTKRCWKHLGLFTDVGDELLRRYEGATHVQRSNKDPHKLRPVRRGVRRPKRKDLVYIDESPDYCQSDTRIGVLGTQNRRCNSTSSGADSCSLLCCGRGYQEVVEEIEEDCNCKFVWCCQVKCDKCKRRITNDVCN